MWTYVLTNDSRKSNYSRHHPSFSIEASLIASECIWDSSQAPSSFLSQANLDQSKVIAQVISFWKIAFTSYKYTHRSTCSTFSWVGGISHLLWRSAVRREIRISVRGNKKKIYSPRCADLQFCRSWWIWNSIFIAVCMKNGKKGGKSFWFYWAETLFSPWQNTRGAAKFILPQLQHAEITKEEAAWLLAYNRNGAEGWGENHLGSRSERATERETSLCSIHSRSMRLRCLQKLPSNCTGTLSKGGLIRNISKTRLILILDCTHATIYLNNRGNTISYTVIL